MIAVEAIHVYYGDSHVLQGVSLAVHPGEIVCLLGRNGAGKTTTIRGIMGYNPPRKGTVHLGGRDVTRLPVYRHVRQGMGYVPEDREIFPDLTVAENLEVAILPAGEGREPWTAERIFDKFPLLAPLRGRTGGALSGGEQQMLAIARALMGNPHVLLLDEPCEGLAPVIVESLGEVILDLKREMPILLTEQNAWFAMQISDRGYVLDKGLVKFQGEIGELKANQQVQDRFLSV